MEGASSSLATEVLEVVCYIQYLLCVASSHGLLSEVRAFFPKPETPAYGPLRGPGPSNECSCPPSFLHALRRDLRAPLSLSLRTLNQEGIEFPERNLGKHGQGIRHGDTLEVHMYIHSSIDRDDAGVV